MKKYISNIETPEPLFNPHGTWMDCISSELLLRFWHKKGSPGTFIFHTKFGMKTNCFMTAFGEIRFSDYRMV